jgi:hypothetical protein
VRLAILGGALALLAACGSASRSADVPGINNLRPEPTLRDSNGRQESYTPAREPPSSRKTGK